MRAKYLPQDTEARLHRGICFFEGRPYYLQLMSQTEAQFTPLYGAKAPFNIELPDARLEISSPKLGYLNSKGGLAVYTYRKPERKYKQLLTAASISSFIPFRGHGLYSPDVVYDTLMSKQGESMLLGEYPTLPEVLKKLDGVKVKSLAISRDIALATNEEGITHVFYKMDDVGTIKDKTVEIPSGDVAWVVSRNLEGFDWVVK